MLTNNTPYPYPKQSIMTLHSITWFSWVGKAVYPGSVRLSRRGECVRKGLGEWDWAERGDGERTDRGDGERTERGDGERTDRGECVMEWDWASECGVWFSLGGRGERGGSSGGFRSIRSISVRRGGGGMNSASSSSPSRAAASSPSISASSARDRKSTMPAPKESPTTLMEVLMRSLNTVK